MVPEISDEAIEAFVSFTSASKEQAIAFLQNNNGDSNRAINAYFENPSDPLPQVQELAPASKAHEYQGPGPQRSFDIECIDTGYGAAPSRPPSRVGIREKKDVESTTQTVNILGDPATFSENTDGLTLAQREEHEMQHAMAASLGHDLPTGGQESGVVSSEGAKFGSATRDHYEAQSWALTLHGATSREICIDPDPELRRRVDDTPAFLRPSEDGDYFPSFLTILHAIPLAREELLWRNRVKSDYGHDSQWWNGQPVSSDIDQMETSQEIDAPLEDTVHETQRLMALLDRTNRAFGSADVLCGMNALKCWRPEDRIATFFKIWEEISPPEDDELPQKTFYSRGVKQSNSEDESANEAFSLLELTVDGASSGRTLYQLLDGHIWCDMPGKELDDVWLDEVAPVFTMRITSYNNGNRVDVKIPAVWYPDRYMEHCKEFAAELRKRRIVVDVELEKLGTLIDRFLAKKGGISIDTIVEKVLAGSQVALNGPFQAEDTAKPPSTTLDDVASLVDQLKALSEEITHKIKELEERKKQAIDSLQQLSDSFTGPSSFPDEAPRHKYTLRGVCTEPHILYILKPRKQAVDLMTDDFNDVPAPDEWQWWRISFSVADANVSSASATLKPSPQEESSTSAQAGGKSVSRAVVPDNVDVIGYTARPVREIEVLRAAREGSPTVLLVYANEDAMNFGGEDLPDPLKKFVDMDNELFQQELEAFTAGLQEQTNTEGGLDTANTGADQGDLLMQESDSAPQPAVGDYTQIQDQDGKGQEMQERTGQHSASIVPPPTPPRQRAVGANVQASRSMDQIKEEESEDVDRMHIDGGSRQAPEA
ncbi:hypothetical protein FQN49_007132 [Arthroderma sp. PD_2]|nr:hypothetical protein FQN49_007132 [Arthroderma sp. PD_2]